MASGSKKRQTLAKLNRERAVKEKRALKQARKEARKQAAADLAEGRTPEVLDADAAELPAAGSPQVSDQSSSNARA
jgi:hypothetical protein